MRVASMQVSSLSKLCLDLVQAQSKDLIGQRLGPAALPGRHSARWCESAWQAGRAHAPGLAPAASCLPELAHVTPGTVAVTEHTLTPCVSNNGVFVQAGLATELHKHKILIHL